jgi:DNA repair photolyase
MDYEVLNPPVKDNYVQVGSKMKANPYFGCSHNCLFCPANDGFLNKKVFDEYRKKGTISVVNNIVEHVDNYINNFDGNVSVHLSPVSYYQLMKKSVHL